MTDNIQQLIAYRVVVGEDNIYFFNQTYGAIIEMNQNDMTPHMLWMDEGDDFFTKYQYGGVALYENKLIFAPRCNDKIFVYNLKNGKVKKIFVDTAKVDKLQSVFSEVFIYKRYAFFFPGRYKAIVRMDLDTYELKYIEDWNEVIGVMPESQKTVFSKIKRLNETTFLMPCWQNGVVLEFHTDSETWVQHNTGKDAISDILYDGSKYWVSKKEQSELISMDKDFNLVQKYDCDYKSTINSKGFICLIEGGANLYMIPFYGTGILKMDKGTGRITLIEAETNSCVESMKDENPDGISVFLSSRILPEKYVIFDAMNGAISLFDPIIENKKMYPLHLGSDDLEHVKTRFLKKALLDGVIMETKDIYLNDFLSFIMEGR